MRVIINGQLGVTRNPIWCRLELLKGEYPGGSDKMQIVTQGPELPSKGDAPGRGPHSELSVPRRHVVITGRVWIRQATEGAVESQDISVSMSMNSHHHDHHHQTLWSFCPQYSLRAWWPTRGSTLGMGYFFKAILRSQILGSTYIISLKPQCSQTEITPFLEMGTRKLKAGGSR